MRQDLVTLPTLQGDFSKETEMHELPHGPEVRFDVEQLDFDQLTTMLVDIEQQNEFSTLEMFRRYVRGDYEEVEAIEGWFDLFFLYLGTREVRHFLSP